MKYAKRVFWIVFFILLFISVRNVHGQYAQDCVTGLDNATIIVPTDVDKRLPQDRQMAAGDTVAVRTDRGVCAGFGVIKDTAKTVFAAKGYDQYSGVGFKPGEQLSYEVADATQGDTLDLGTEPVYRPCEGFTLCKDTGDYANGAVYTLDAMSRTAIPIELANFSVRADGTRVELNWTTSSETNNAGFEVQRKDGTWDTLGFVEGAGTTSQSQTYVYRTGQLEAALHTFRLKQIDQDGTVSYSDVRKVELLPTERLVTETRPNPARDEVRVNVKLPTAQTVTGYVANLLGQRTRTLASRNVKGREQIVLDVTSLPSGQYFLVLEGEGWRENRRFTVVK